MNEAQTKHKKMKRRIRRRTILFLIITFIGNSFAWFIYNNRVNGSLNVGVKSWKISFEQSGSNVSENVVFRVENIYPGMTTYTDRVSVTNSGETTAGVTYEITSVKIFDQTYTNDDYTSNQLIDMLKENYPFKVTFSVDNDTIVSRQSTNFRMNIRWPYESGDDEADTYWGKEAYNFESMHPTSDEIVINCKIIATQVT